MARSRSATSSLPAPLPRLEAFLICVQTIEADISRFKRVIRGALRSRTDERRATEIAIGALKRMLELGRPEYVRKGVTADLPTALPRLRAGPCNSFPQKPH